jgi:antitoxin (DNA-binding transcriptional repressor) of toxin-antitoxin stability system
MPILEEAEAIQRWEQILEIVADGGEVAIVRSGMPIARLVPPVRRSQEAEQAFEELRRLRRGTTLRDPDWRKRRFTRD